MHVVDQISLYHRARLPTQRVDAAAVGQHLHHIVDVIVLHPAAALAGRCGIPTKSDGDAGVGQVIDQIVEDGGVAGKGIKDADGAEQLSAATGHPAIADAVVTGHIAGIRPVVVEPVARRTIRLGPPAAHDAVAADVGKGTTFDAVIPAAGSQAHAAGAGVLQPAAFKAALFGIGPLNSERQPIGGIRGVAGTIKTSLNAGIADIGQGPAGMGEIETLEKNAPDRLSAAAVQDQQLFTAGCDE
ncbi:MAG: hypothetical protein BWY83_02902 [bacterium ADurb.Bin478]|nr:MAG: hypothetical protein BWY83_02902 [bacterium ADurb.Bin478]